MKSLTSPRRRRRERSTSALGRARRNLRVEALEGRMLLATLVSEVIGGTADTTIGGTVYEDLDANGRKNGGENGIPNWTVFLDLDNSGTLNTDAVGAMEPSAVTNKDGDYVIQFLKPGTYAVSTVLPDGWISTGPASQNVLVRDTKDSVADFFVFNNGPSGQGGIVGQVWQDLNADGIRDTDPATGEFVDLGLQDWTIFIDLNNNRALDPSEPVTITDANGAYSFSDLSPGDYEVFEIVPDGWEVSPTFDNKQTVAVTAGSTKVAKDFANFSNLNGSITGVVWNDLNANGVRDIDPLTGEFTDPGLESWTIYLDLNNNLTFDPDEPSTSTDASGNYVFASLLAGDYEVTEVLPSGWNPSRHFDERQTVTVEGGTISVADDFANYGISNGNLLGVIWNDLNANGFRETDPITGLFTEPGLSGWTVYLDLNRNGLQDSEEPTAITDVDGGYAFLDLTPAEYKVREILPAGWETSPTYDDNFSIDIFGGGVVIAPEFANYNIGVGVPGSISGIVWNDLDGNGIRATNPVTGEFTELGVAGWTVFIDQNFNGVLDPGESSVLTSADGSYSFGSVAPGSVTVVSQLLAGWRGTAPLSSTRSVTLKSSGTATGIDFGTQELRDSTIHGTIYADADKNGTRNLGEQGLPGIVVYLDLNNNSQLDPGEPQTVTSDDLYYTPGVDEAGSYSFTHLAKGTYTVREIIPPTLSSTPETEREHVVTIGAAEDHGGVDSAAVYRPNEIHGTKFEDSNGNHLRDPGEMGIGGVTIFVDLNRNNQLDAGEPSTVTLADGTYSFTDMVPGAYIIREIVTAGYERTYPSTVGGTLWPQGVSNPAVGDVTPSTITTSLSNGELHRQSVSITLPNTGALTNLVDVFLLFDDTGSFVGNSPIVRGAFPTIISQLQAALPGIDLGFGVGRLEEYGNFAAEYATGRPFILNQPIVAASTPGYLAAIQAALDRTTPGYGGDQPETVIEALYQVVTGKGFDGNNNGSVLDSGLAGLASTQLNPGASGDVPSFASFVADPTNSVMPAAGSLGGAGFRAGALPIILTATDTGFAYQPNGESFITGSNGVSLPISSLTQTSRGSTPFSSGAKIQETITGLNALGALVIGLGTNPQATLDPRQGLEALSKLTGATNQSTTTIDNGTTDPIAPGDPFYFQIASGFAASVASGVVNAIQNAVTNVAVNITLQASDPRVKIINHTGTLNGIVAGQTATFDVEFVGDGRPHRFDLQFVREGTNVVLGSIPVVIGTPVPGDGYEYEDLEEGEIETDVDFGNHLLGTSAVNVAPSFTAGSDQIAAEDADLQTIVAWATSIAAGPASESSQTVQFQVNNDNPSLFSVPPSITPNGTLSFKPAANAFGTAMVTVQLRDNGGTDLGGVDTSALQTFTISITPVNDVPAATDDSYALSEDTTLEIALPGVLSNDTDIDGEALTSAIVDQPSHGTIAMNADGSFSYTPDADYHGSDSFTYQASDAVSTSNLATVTLTIASTNDAPVATNDAYVTSEDASLLVDIHGLLENDTDTDDDLLTVALVSGPSHGTLTLGSDGLFTYIPDKNFHGSDSFTYVANDGTTDSNHAVVTIDVSSVNDAPLAADDIFTTNEEVALLIPAMQILANDSDVEGDILTIKIVAEPAHGNLAVDPSGNWIYTPNANFVGSDSFRYTANDGLLDSNVAIVTINVDPTNDPPVAADDSYTTDEDVPLVVDVATGLLSNDSDIDSASILAVLETAPKHGALSLASDGSFTYTPDANYYGEDSFTYRASDGTAMSQLATVFIIVKAVNDAPVALPDNYAMKQGELLNLPLSTGVLANDSDVDGDLLTAVVVTVPAHGTLNLDSRGSFSYSPDPTFAGTDSFTYSATDGSLSSNVVTVTITITPTLPIDTTKFIVVDSSSRRSFNYDANGALVESNRLDKHDEGPRGVAANADGSRYWVVDAKGEVFVYNQQGQELGSWKYRNVDKPEGIATDGKDIWLVDRESDRVYFFPGAANMHAGSARPVSSFKLNSENRNPTDITTDGKHLWVVDDTSHVDKVFRYSIDGKFEGSWAIDSENSSPTGLTIDPNNVAHIWIVDAKSDRVYQYDNAASLVAGQQSANASFALASANHNPQGIADPLIKAPSATFATTAPAVATSPSLAVFTTFAERPASATPTAVRKNDSDELIQLFASQAADVVTPAMVYEIKTAEEQAPADWSVCNDRALMDLLAENDDQGPFDLSWL